MEEVDFEETRRKLDVMMFSEDEDNVYEVPLQNFSPRNHGGFSQQNGMTLGNLEENSLIKKRQLPPVSEEDILHKAKPEMNKDLVIFSSEILEKNKIKEEQRKLKAKKMKEKKKKEEAKKNKEKERAKGASTGEVDPKKLKGLDLFKYNMEQKEKKKQEEMERKKKGKSDSRPKGTKENLY